MENLSKIERKALKELQAMFSTATVIGNTAWIGKTSFPADNTFSSLQSALAWARVEVNANNMADVVTDLKREKDSGVTRHGREWCLKHGHAYGYIHKLADAALKMLQQDKREGAVNNSHFEFQWLDEKHGGKAEAERRLKNHKGYSSEEWKKSNGY